MSNGFEPVIITFLCSWCSYRAADLAGTARLHYASDMRPVRVMCTGRIEPELVMEAFEKGADGVLIAGCHPGECHYTDGNIKALRRYTLLKQTLAQFCIEPERFQIIWASASEGAHLAKTIEAMSQTLKALGPRRKFVLEIDETGFTEIEPPELLSGMVNPGETSL